MRIKRKHVVLGVFTAAVAAQIVPMATTNPPVEPTDSIYAKLSVPPVVAGIFERSCLDCHSSQTAWPWYSRVAPISWLIVSDVNRGRSELNLSEWGRYTPRRKDRKLKEICDQVRSGEMPMKVYTLVHPRAKLTDPDRKAMCDWTNAARRSLVASNPVALVQ